MEWSDDGRPLRLTGDPVRDEAGQAAHLLEVLDVLDARYDLPHREAPGTDFDLASYASSRAAPATRTRTCRGSRRPPSPSPTATETDAPSAVTALTFPVQVRTGG